MIDNANFLEKKEKEHATDKEVTVSTPGQRLFFCRPLNVEGQNTTTQGDN